MAISVKLEKFEGPLDLLLHLIEKNQMNIYDIQIAEITDQYMEYLRSMETEDMNIMSEFLVMAATLLDIKCKMLLPKHEEEEEEEDDPRAELVQKLLEYKMYKYMSFELKDLFSDATRSVYKKRTLPEEVLSYQPPVNYEDLVGDMNLQKLNDIFQEVLRRQEERIDPIRSKFGNVTKDEVPLEEKTQDVLSFLSENEYCSFRDLLKAQCSKMEIVVSFLVILEMMKLGQIVIEQDDLFDDIRIHRVVAADALSLGDTFAIL